MTMKDGYVHMFLLASTSDIDSLFPDFEDLLKTVEYK